MDPLSAVGEQPDRFISSGPTRANTLQSGSSGSSSFDLNSDTILLRHTGSGFAEWGFNDNDTASREAPDSARLGRFDHPDCSFSLVSVGQQPINCDIIFVHGLSGDDRTTWKASSVSWPEELALECKNARLLSFKYNRSIWTGSDMRSMQSASEQLLAMLTTYRRRDVSEHRPIIFVAHSLGGWLVKAAVALAKGYGSLRLWPTYGDINDCTKGVVFFGTPHRTRTLMGWNSILHRIQAASQYVDNAKELQPPPPPEERPKAPFMKLLSAFESSLDDGHIAIYSCFENHETGTDRVATLVTSGDNALGHRFENVVYLDGNHATMCQFQTTNDIGYKIVKDLVLQVTDQSIGRALRTFRTAFPAFGQSHVGFPSSGLENFIMAREAENPEQADSASDIDSGVVVAAQVARLFLPTVMLRRIKRILTHPIFGLEYVESLLSQGEVPEWVTKNEQYLAWRHDKPLLLITSPVGAGKSAVAYYIATQLATEYGPKARQVADRDEIVLHHFFNNQSDPEDHFSQLLHQFILQLLELNPSLVRHFSTSQVLTPPKRRNCWPFKTRPASFIGSRNNGQDGDFPPPRRTASGIELRNQHDTVPIFTGDDLVTTLFSMLRENPVAQIFIIIDGLDECDSASQPLVKRLLKRMQALQNTKICLTFHSTASIVAEFVDNSDKVSSIDITKQEEHRRSITAFARRQLKDIERHMLERRFQMPDEYFERIQKLFSNSHHVSFLWIKLVRRVINGVRNLPALQAFIDIILPVGATEYTLDIENLHHWILEFLIGNRQKLAVFALFFVGLASRPLRPDELSALLATTTCIKEDGSSPISPVQRLQRMPTISISMSLARRTMPSLTRTSTPTLEHRRTPPWSQKAQEERMREEFWRWMDVENLSEVTLGSMEDESRTDLESWLSTELFQLLTFQGGVVSLDHPSLKHSIVSFLTRNHPGKLQVLQREIAQACLTHLCLPRRSDVVFEYNPKLKTHSPPILQFAYSMKNWHKHLKEAGVLGASLVTEVEELWDDPQFHDPLLQLSGKYYTTDYRPDLSCMLALLDADVVLNKHLLDDHHNSDLDMAKSNSTLAMAYAAANGSIKSLEVITKATYNSENVNQLLSVGAKILTLAGETGKSGFFEQASKFLNSYAESLTRESGSPPKFSNTETTLFEASQAMELIRLAITARDSDQVGKALKKAQGRSDLSQRMKAEGLRLAIRNSDQKMADCLIVNGANVNSKGPNGESPLHWAAAAGDLGVVRLLVEKRARKSAADNEGKKPIHWAARRGHARVVEYLLSSSVDKDTKSGRTPLFSACSFASLSTIQVLLDYGASINFRDIDGRTPLHLAASIGAKDAVRLLLVEGADPNVKDNKGLTPLQLACFGGWDPVVTALLSAAALVNQTSKNGQTALHLATISQNPTLSVVEALLSAHADANIMDKAGHKPLYLAIKHGSPEMVKILLVATSFATMQQAERNTLLQRARKYKGNRPENCFLVEKHLRNLEEAEALMDGWVPGTRYIKPQP